jgi:hypothetical protein
MVAMNLIPLTNNVLIYDNFLDEQMWQQVWEFVQSDAYAMPHLDGWKKVWRISDRFPLVSQEETSPQTSLRPIVKELYTAFLQIANAHPEVLGKQGREWTDIRFRTFLYASGSRLSWHNDYGYAGALIYYPHQNWNCSWGGELLVASTPDVPFTQGKLGSHLQNHEESRYILEKGFGLYISPKPNRLILMGPTVWHSIARVDSDAGANVRASISAFLK